MQFLDYYEPVQCLILHENLQVMRWQYTTPQNTSGWRKFVQRLQKDTIASIKLLE